MSSSLRYCHGCNEKFAAQSDNPICPVCGQRLSSLADAPTAEVLLTANPPAVEPSEPEAEVPHEVEADEESLVGQQLGHYLIEEFIGRGGMARVYRGTHRMLERPCAIKVLDPKLAERDPEYVTMFEEEARAAAALVHPNVVTVHNIGFDQGRHYIEMEHVSGDSLQRLVTKSGRLETIRAVEIIEQTCSGLAEAHRLGIVHRDFKPANVLVGQEGVVKLADFGLAKRVHSLHSGLRGGIMVGTPYYMAPELFHRQPASKQSDVYAAGVTFYYLLTGELPYVDTSLADLAKKHEGQALPSDLPSSVEIPEEALVVIRRCLAKNLDERYSDASELSDALRALYGNLRSLGSLLRDAFHGTGQVFCGSAGSYSVSVSLPDGRTQEVRVETSRAGRIIDRLVRIFSVCAPLKQSYFRRALELNAEMPHGSIAVQDIEGVPHFVMVNAYPRASCDALEIRQSVLEIARWADHVEKTLTGADRH